jgi:hypothetical protein
MLRAPEPGGADVLSKPTELASVDGQRAVESQPHDPEAGAKTVYWHRELPPLHAEPLGEHIVEADSMRVIGNLAHRGDLWDRCSPALMARLEERLHQEAARLGGHYAHVLEESIDSRHDDRSGDVWLRGRLKYLLLRRPCGN